MSTYMSIKGITGSATDQEHKGWIPLLGKSFLVGVNVQSTAGYNSHRKLGTLSMGEFNITKAADESSAQLLHEVIASNNIPEVIIDVCRGGEGKQVTDRYTLKDVIISHFEEGSSDQVKSGSVEFLVLNFRHIEVRHTPYNQAGKPKTPYSVAYDLNTASVS